MTRVRKRKGPTNCITTDPGWDHRKSGKDFSRTLHKVFKNSEGILTVFMLTRNWDALLRVVRISRKYHSHATVKRSALVHWELIMSVTYASKWKSMWLVGDSMVNDEVKTKRRMFTSVRTMVDIVTGITNTNNITTHWVCVVVSATTRSSHHIERLLYRYQVPDMIR